MLNKRLVLILLILTLALTAGCGGGSAVTPGGYDEIEPNDTFDTAQLVSLPLSNFTGRIDQNADIYDLLKFQVQAGQQITAIVTFDFAPDNFVDLQMYRPDRSRKGPVNWELGDGYQRCWWIADISGVWFLEINAACRTATSCDYSLEVSQS